MTELPLRAKEIIEDLPLRGVDRWYVLLACLGLKKGSWLQLHSDYWRQGDAPLTICKDRQTRIEQSLKELGLYYTLRIQDASDAGMHQPSSEQEGRKRFNQICDIFIATTQQRADELRDAVLAGDHKRIGYALDFPTTAVEEFDIDRGRLITDDEIEKSGKFDQEVIDVTYFIPSKDHYVEELTRVQVWLDALKQTSTIAYLDLNRRYL